MATVIRFIVVFMMVAASTFLLSRYLGFEFGSQNYWDNHGLLFLFFITLFPRLTLLFSSVATGGILWWLGWLFVPRILVAMLATAAYWNQNPVLVVISWLIAIGGESTEKLVVVRRSPAKMHFRSRPRGDIIDVTPNRPGS